MNDKNTLLTAIKDAGLLSQSKVTWVVSPILEEMALKFASYVGSYSLTQNGKPLLQHCLKEAFSKYKKELDASHTDQAAVAQFAKSLIAGSSDVFAQQLVVETPSGDIEWMPFVCGANEFLSKFPPSAKVSNTRVESRISESIACAFMMTKILPFSLLDKNSLAELLGETKVES